MIGLQYYHVAKIVLAVSGSPSLAVGYENLKHLRNIEVCRAFRNSYSDVCLLSMYDQKTIRNHLLIVLGLARSNTKAENALFTARHSLVACKYTVDDLYVSFSVSAPLVLKILTT